MKNNPTKAKYWFDTERKLFCHKSYTCSLLAHVSSEIALGTFLAFLVGWLRYMFLGVSIGPLKGRCQIKGFKQTGWETNTEVRLCEETVHKAIYQWYKLCNTAAAMFFQFFQGYMISVAHDCSRQTKNTCETLLQTLPFEEWAII